MTQGNIHRKEVGAILARFRVKGLNTSDEAWKNADSVITAHNAGQHFVTCSLSCAGSIGRGDRPSQGV
jgi:hypothetical protein